MLGTIAYSEQAVFDDFVRLFDLKGKKVLEIGGALDSNSILESGVKEWVSVDPLNENMRNDSIRRIKGVGSSIPLKSDYFDYVFSSNAFEHIIDLKGTIQECKRLLKKKGVLYSHFGPIWSAPDGHHLDIEIEGELTDFSEDFILPHWIHLTHSEGEIRKALSIRYNDEDAENILKAIYKSKWLNRLYFEDYVDIFKESGLRIVKLETTEEVDYPFVHPNYGIEEIAIKERLDKMYKNNNRNYHCRDILIILVK